MLYILVQWHEYRSGLEDEKMNLKRSSKKRSVLGSVLVNSDVSSLQRLKLLGSVLRYLSLLLWLQQGRTKMFLLNMAPMDH